MLQLIWWAIDKVKSFFVSPTDHTNSDGAYPNLDEKEPLPARFDWQSEYKRVAILVGHTKSAKGAISYSQVREYDWNKERAKEIKEYLDQNYLNKASKIFYRDGIGLAGAAKMMANWKADICIELHFNSIGSEKDAFGTEMLVLAGDDLSAKVGYNIVGELSKQFKTKRRNRYKTSEDELLNGVKTIKRADRGYNNLNRIRKAGIPVRLLIEPFFAGTQTRESEQFIQNPLKYSRVLAKELGEL